MPPMERRNCRVPCRIPSLPHYARSRSAASSGSLLGPAPVVPGRLHDHGKIELGSPICNAAGRSAKCPVNERSPGTDRPVPGPVMAGGIPEIGTGVIVSVIYQLSPHPETGIFHLQATPGATGG